MLPLQFILYWKRNAIALVLKGRLNHLKEAVSICAEKHLQGDRDKRQGKHGVVLALYVILTWNRGIKTMFLANFAVVVLSLNPLYSS